MAESITTRCAKLNQIFLSKNGGRKASSFLSKETLLDAFLVLFDECKSEELFKDKNMSSFVKKYSPMVKELRKLCLNKDDFDVINTIGRGHFGQVQVVKDKHSGDVYAMKTLKKSQTLAQESVAFYEEEREIMATANNPWITSLQYAFQDSNCLYFVMEYQPGGDLLSLLSKYDEVFEEEMARFYLAEMVMAIHSLHVLGFVHRDVKPDNVLIDRTGHIKLADFGSSARLSADKIVYSKMPVGTPEYIAPEVLTSMDGSGGPYGVECDWWSLGVVAYEMLCGQTPFEADSVVITYSKIMNYKASMRFPPDLKISAEAKNLILSLCTGSKDRIGYDGIGCHRYFNGIEWEKLQTTVPPFVPTLEGTDDTSNFDEFEPESPDPTDQLQKYSKKGFVGRDLPFVGFSFIKHTSSLASPRRQGSLTLSPANAQHSTSLEKRLTMKAKELKDALNSCHVLTTEKENMTKSLDDMKNNLSEKEKALRIAENERDLLEKEKVMFDSQIKDLQRRLDSERAERNNTDFKTLKLITEIKQNSRKVEEMRDQETKASIEDQQQIISELEQERFIANKRAHRLEEELKTQESVIEEGKHRINDLHSRISKMNEEARRSMEEWQAKLDKVSEDSQCRINELQDKLNKSLKSCQEATDLLENVRRAKNDLEKQLQIMQEEKKKSEKDETDGKKNTFRRSDSIVSAIRRREDLAQQIVDRIRACGEFQNQLNEEGNLREKYKEKAAELRRMSSKVMDLEDKLFKNQREMKKLEREVGNKQTIEEKLQAKDKDLTTANRYKRQLESTIKKLQEDLDEKDKAIESRDTKIKVLQARSEEQSIGEVDMPATPRPEDLVMMEQLKQEKEDTEKELHDQQQKNQSLLDKIRSSEDKLFEAQSEISELQNSNKSLEDAVRKLENEIDEKLLKQEMKAASLLAFDDLELQERAEIALELQHKLQETTKHCEALESQKKELEMKLDNLNEKYSKIDLRREKMEDELKEKQRKLEGQELTISMLKSTCSMLESQVEELEIMNEGYEEKQGKLEITRKNLEKSNEQDELVIAEIKRSAEQDKLARSVAEEKLAKSQKDLDELQIAHIKEVDETNEKLKRQRERTDELTQSLGEAEKKHGMVAVELKSVQRKLQLEIESNNKYKIENERLESQISNLKATNFQINQNIAAVMEKFEEVTNERAALAEQLDVMESSYAEERLKLEATKAQQTKLIDFLQYKTEGQNMKKKKLIGGGGKTWRKQHHDERNVVPKQWKDMQQALEKERASSLKLQTELNRTKAELKTAKMEVAEWKSQCQNSTISNRKPAQKVAVLSALQQSPSNQQAPKSTLKNSNPAGKPPLPTEPAVHRPKERMHHNIPHRFVNALNMRPVKCAVCLDTVHFGRQSSKCAECSSVCHNKCAPHLSHTCGLPSQFVDHFSEALSDNKTDSPVKSSASSLNGGIENWMKVPSGSVKYGWEKTWVMLRDNKIQLFDKENVKDKTSPTETLHLDGTDGHVTIHSSVMSSELLGTAPTDLAYILRIESRPKCWPVQNLYLMAPSFGDKQKWVAALENTLSQIKKANQSKSDEKLFGNSLLYLENSEKIDVNCTQLLSDELLLLGAEEGLFSLSLSKPGHGSHRVIPGIERVFQIDVIPELNIAIMLTGKERHLCSVDLKQLNSRAKQVNSEVPLTPLTSQTIEKIKNCHLFAMGQYDGSYYVCAATPNKLHLLRFNAGMNAFCTRKEIDTADPCNCIHFTDTSVVYGTGKFYSLDLRQYSISEFLDAQDTSLAFAVYGAAQLNIFPIAVLDVTSAGCKDREFLLCYNEFGVFINSAGRQTRQKTLMWTRLPLAFAYKTPFLFVTHFNSIDVCEIPPSNSPDAHSFTHKFMEIQNPRVLGPAVLPGAVYIVSSLQDSVEMLCFQGSSVATSSCQSDEDLSDFSHLSEMLRSISATSLTSEIGSPGGPNDDEKMKTPANTKKRRSSFLSNGPFRTPSMRKKKCYEVNH